MSPVRVLIVGDTHGNVDDLIPKVYKAGDHGIQHVLVVGDFGLWTHFADGHEFLDDVNEAARINNLSVYAVGGNHENWDHWNWFIDNSPTGGKGFAMVRRRVLLAPKAHQWKWAGKTFIGAGGAVSVDKDSRRAMERGDVPGERKYGDRTLWWDNEQLTDWEVERIKSWGKADYLITHDCSNYTPWRSRLKPDIDSQIHRQRIDEVLKSVQPKMHFHGHMHQKYDWFNNYSGQNDEGVGCRTLGLEAFQGSNSWGVLDVVEDKWFWPDEYGKSVADRKARKAAHDAERYARSGNSTS